MQRKPHLVFLLILVLLFPRAAAAKTVEPLPLTLSVDHLVNMSVFATVDGYDREAGTFTVTLYELETFSAESIESLEIGDEIISGGKTWQVQRIDRVGWAVQINNNHGGDYEPDALTLSAVYDYIKTVYRANVWGDYVWLPVGEIRLSLDQDWLFLDGIDLEIGWRMDKPEILTPPLFAELYVREETESGCGFSAHNCYIVFDGKGNPMFLYRFHTEWQ